MYISDFCIKFCQRTNSRKLALPGEAFKTLILCVVDVQAGKKTISLLFLSVWQPSRPCSSKFVQVLPSSSMFVHALLPSSPPHHVWFFHVLLCSSMFVHVRPCSSMFVYLLPHPLIYGSSMFVHVRPSSSMFFNVRQISPPPP